MCVCVPPGGGGQRSPSHPPSSRVLDRCDCHSQSVLRGEPVPIFINVFVFISPECHSSQRFFNAAALASQAARACLLSSCKLITPAITAKVPAVKQQWLLISISGAHLLISPTKKKNSHRRRPPQGISIKMTSYKALKYEIINLSEN